MKKQYDQYNLMNDAAKGEVEKKVDDGAITAQNVLDAVLPEKIRKEIDEELPDPEENYSDLMRLKKKIISVYSEEEYDRYTKEQVDSMLTDFSNDIDTLAMHQDRYIRDLKELYYGNRKLKKQRDSLYAELASLRENLNQVKSESRKIKKKRESEKNIKSAKYLADTYNKMNPAKVAQLMMSMKDSKNIEILKLMNQRKAAKVLEAMPAGKSSVLVKKIARGGK